MKSEIAYDHPMNKMSKEESDRKIKEARQIIFRWGKTMTGKKHPFKTMIRAK